VIGTPFVNVYKSPTILAVPAKIATHVPFVFPISPFVLKFPSMNALPEVTNMP